MECKDRKKIIYSSKTEKYFFCELIFEIRERRDSEHTYVIGMWDDLLGSPIQKVWKIIEKKIHHDEYYDIGGSE
jgi:hypothetical protein